MFLKRIVLHGFKSFADRTEFEFGAGITGIVGPNGCGKSNILDAVRWVLGEQSARSLRGGKMADVIFAGSRSRKPANSAQVLLTFDNRAGVLRSDHEEVVVGRVLYANGDSEYRLNGNTCRLKDVRELLLDTGVGVDAYSVIEQGRVDVLLQASPVERREIFEEAAGISRYKVRRAEAQRKLERTQNNLLRLQDILEELERRLRSVRLAAGKARNYQQYDARLRERRSSFSLAEYHELEQNRRSVQQEIDGLTSQTQELRAGLAATDAEAGERAHALGELDDRIQAAEAELLELQTALSALAERITQGQRRRGDLVAMRERRQRQVADGRTRLAALEERLAEEQATLARLQAAEAECTQRVDEVHAAREASVQRTDGSREALEREKVAAYEAVRQAALLQNEHGNLAQQEARLTAQTERLRARQQEVARAADELSRQLDELDRELEASDGKSAELATTLRAAEARLEALRGEADELEHKIGAAKESRSAHGSRLALLEDMDRRLEGVDQGTRDVLAWRDDPALENVVVDLVADLLRIDDPRVALLQPVLSTFEDHVVVRDTARFFDELARRDDLPGPVRALALDRIKTRVLSDGYEQTPGFVARGADWVKCAPEFRPLATHVLGRAIIVDTLDRALRLADQALAGYVFITLDGWTVGADGRLTQGSLAAAAGLISRKAEIRQLHVELDEIETRLEQLTRQRSAAERSASDLQLRRDGLLEQIATTQREHAELRSQRVRLDDQRQRLSREGEVVDEERGTAQRGLDALREQLRELADERQTVGQAQRTREAQLDGLGRDLDESEATLQRLSQEYTETLVEKGRAAEKRAACDETLRELRARQVALADQQAEAEREAEQATGEIDAAERELSEARQRQERDQAECARQQDAALGLRETRQGMQRQLEECGAAGREVQRRLEEVESALHEQQVAQREIEVRKEGLVARVHDELALDLAECYTSYEHCEQDWEAIRSEIEELRGKITRLGNVNLDAITELDELTPRYEHLVTQRDDLVDSIARLENLIGELDDESRARFAATFEQVRVNFQEMFRKLFGGGKADIILEDPENPLECGIDIIARPPGKEPRSISLLSGGEKTMTAVALLMGVFKSRPSPFAILDEVDAALDESNIDRFNTLLNEFLSTSQFVVITHSKRTMASVDVLYGITMEEPGVSKRVSVRFDDRVNTPSVA